MSVNEKTLPNGAGLLRFIQAYDRPYPRICGIIMGRGIAISNFTVALSYYLACECQSAAPGRIPPTGCGDLRRILGIVWELPADRIHSAGICRCGFAHRHRL